MNKIILLSTVFVIAFFKVNAQLLPDSDNHTNTRINIGSSTSQADADIKIEKDEDRLLYLKILNSSAGTSAGSAVYLSSTYGGTYAGRISYLSPNYSTYPSFANFMELASFANSNGILLRTSASAGIIKFITQGDQERLRITQDGYVGLGTTEPSSIFHIKKSLSGDNSQLKIENGYGASFWLGISGNDENQNSFIKTHSDEDLHFMIGQAVTDSTPRMIIKADGKVGIGTTSPDSKLTVAGKIHSQEVKVSVEAGADFVFDESYELKTLKETEEFINQNKHLPEIASEEEMLENGLEIGEMNIKLLQKIEELTLYLIEQNKQNQDQQDEIEILKKKISQLENK